MENFDGFGHTEFQSHTLTGAAANYAVPQPSEVTSVLPSGNALLADELQLDAPAGNIGNVFVDLPGTATISSLILRPGDSKRISGAPKSTLSALAVNAGDLLEVHAFYR